MNKRAKALLDAHVTHVLDELDGESLADILDSNVDTLLAGAERIPLGELVSAEAVAASVRHYVSKLEPSDALSAVIGQIARVCWDHEIHADTRLDELMTDDMFTETLDWGLAQDELRKRAIEESVGNPVYAALVSDLMYNGIKDYIASVDVTGRIPGAKSALKIGRKLADRARPGIEGSLDEGLRSYVRKNTSASLKASERFLNERFDEDSIRDMALDVWKKHKGRRVSELQSLVEPVEIEKIADYEYRFICRAQQSDYVLTLIEAGIGAFFEHYAERPLAELMRDASVSEALIRDAVRRYAPDAIEALRSDGVLETLVRDNLQRFYSSPVVATLLAE